MYDAIDKQLDISDVNLYTGEQDYSKYFFFFVIFGIFILGYDLGIDAIRKLGGVHLTRLGEIHFPD